MLLPADPVDPSSIRAIELCELIMQDNLLIDVDVCVFDTLSSGATVVQRELQ